MKPVNFLLFLFIVSCSVVCSAQVNYMYTIAGNGVQGNTGDGGPAIHATMYDVRGITTDKYGNIYFADFGNHNVRRIDAVTGKMTLVAGTGVPGSNGLGQLAIYAELSLPSDVAVDQTGNVYISNNSGIRKVDAVTGIISALSTINGNTLYVDASNNLYVGTGDQIKKMDGQTSQVNVICGITSGGYDGDGGLAINAKINQPRGMTHDKDGNLIFLDKNNYVVRKIDKITNIITTIAGTGTIGTSGDGGPATAAQLDEPFDIGVDIFGNIYIAEHERIRKVDVNTGIISTHAGVLGPGIAMEGSDATTVDMAPRDMAVDLYGNIFYPDIAERIKKITPNTPIVNTTTSNFTLQLHSQCNGPQIAIITPQYSPGLSVKTSYGDGTEDVLPLISSYGHGYLPFSHVYNFSGKYHIKHVLLNNNIPVDSTTYAYEYHMCRSVSVNCYLDNDNDCNFNPTVDAASTQVATIVVDSNGVAVDTFSVTSGFIYNAYGDGDDVYSFNILSTPPGTVAVCSNVVDTLRTLADTGSHRIAFQCLGTSGFDLMVSASQQTAGNRAQANININNDYCTAINSQLTMTFSPKYSFAYAVPPPTLQAGNVLTWNLNANSFEDNFLHVHADFNHNGQILMPGDTVQTMFIISPTNGDDDTTNNTIIKHDTVTGPFDPNAVYVSPGSCVVPGTKLQYTVTFENMGNDTAHDIIVMDTLSAGFDVQSFQLISASHLMNVSKTIVDGNFILRFEFPNIDLPDSSSPYRHGAVMYTINMKNNFPIESEVANKAGIFFDYMPAVLTNVAATEACWPVSVKLETSVGNNISIYPNPATSELTIQTTEQYRSFTITNSIGQTMLLNELNGKATKLDIESLPPGLYYISLEGEKDIEVRRFVKI